MRPMEVLKELNLVCWSTLLIGFQRGWATKSDISAYAAGLLSSATYGGDENIAILAASNSLDDSEVEDLMLQVGGLMDTPEALEEWRLATLIALSKSALSEQEKIDKLQELYADFDYPEDMASCSIYSQNAVDPLVAMSEVIYSLKKRLIG